ncbi:hypothetical protein HK104_006089 [Borealophlyctis nickersoniae]|nr:hypothetical protein HK104_006089 [Borealophlyctis nickersoniae]
MSNLPRPIGVTPTGSQVLQSGEKLHAERKVDWDGPEARAAEQVKGNTNATDPKAGNPVGSRAVESNVIQPNPSGEMNKH